MITATLAAPHQSVKEVTIESTGEEHGFSCHTIHSLPPRCSSTHETRNGPCNHST